MNSFLIPQGELTAYNSDFGSSVACWAPSAGAPALQDLTAADLRRKFNKLSSHAITAPMALGVKDRHAGGRRRPRSAGPASSTRYVPFVTTEQRRGKFSRYPMQVAEGHLHHPSDTIGFTRDVHLNGSPKPRPDGGVVKAFPMPGVIKGGRREGGGRPIHHLDPRSRITDDDGVRGRACRYPRGGYRMEAQHAISPLDPPDGPELWKPYWELEKQRRGKNSKYPHDLDPYPSSPK